VKVLGLSTSAASNHRTFVVGTGPTQISPYHHPGYLAEGPCNMGAYQHEPTIEIGKAQEALKLSECGWGWSIMDDLDLGWIYMYTMSINDVSHVIDHVHVEVSFFQVGVELVLS
jgi:hypothetical protein